MIGSSLRAIRGAMPDDNGTLIHGVKDIRFGVRSGAALTTIFT